MLDEDGLLAHMPNHGGDEVEESQGEEKEEQHYGPGLYQRRGKASSHT